MDATPKIEFRAEAAPPAGGAARSLTSEAERRAMAVLALSHTKLEQKIYQIMFDETRRSDTRVGEFSTRFLKERAPHDSDSRLQRARRGLIAKMSIEPLTIVSQTRQFSIYTVYSPSEILERRRRAQSTMPAARRDDETADAASSSVIERVVENNRLSRREAQVTLCCAEGMTNHEIGEKLFIHEETVKFHLRNVFMKLGIKRRTELIAHLFRN